MVVPRWLARLRPDTLLSVWEEDVEGEGDKEGEECWESGGVGEGGALRPRVFSLETVWLVAR